MRLAEECKQVFTELQTDLADLNSDFSPATIPYHSFDEYALKVLFPGWYYDAVEILKSGHAWFLENLYLIVKKQFGITTILCYKVIILLHKFEQITLEPCRISTIILFINITIFPTPLVISIIRFPLSFIIPYIVVHAICNVLSCAFYYL